MDEWGRIAFHSDFPWKIEKRLTSPSRDPSFNHLVDLAANCYRELASRLRSGEVGSHSEEVGSVEGDLGSFIRHGGSFDEIDSSSS